MFFCKRLLIITSLLFCPFLYGQEYPSNAKVCEECHNAPGDLGSSHLTVRHTGFLAGGKFIPGPENGISHRNRPDTKPGTESEISGERVTISLLGDGYIEAIDDRDIMRNVSLQRGNGLGILGVAVHAPILESSSTHLQFRIGRFGWKAQHSSLKSACADSLRNELGVRNALYPKEYPNESGSPMDTEGKLEKILERVRNALPPDRDEQLAVSFSAKVGEKIFSDIGCNVCHVATYKTLPLGTLINGGTYRIPASIGSTTIHPYSDFLLHDIGTGDGVPEAAKTQYLNRETANQFRTAPLWGLRYRSWMMHDGKSITYHQAIMRHNGEAQKVRQRYEILTPVQKEQLQSFLNSL
jgi:CxxC motif-containing protein (DUF1111 family)